MVALHFDSTRAEISVATFTSSVRDTTAPSPKNHAGECEPSTVIALLNEDKKTREAIEDALQASGYSMTEFNSVSEFFAQAKCGAACCLILDSSFLSACPNGEQQRLVSLSVDLPVIHLMSTADVRTAVKVMKSGAANLLLKPVDSDALISAVNRAVHVNRPTNGGVDMLAHLRRRHATLTPREHQVMVMLTNGKRNKQIADALLISIITVKVHRSRIMRKMRVASFADLVRASIHLNASELKSTGIVDDRPSKASC
jgi:two-component system, LuxR family, response regulator FixJ